MRRTLPQCFAYTRIRLSSRSPIVSINNATFYRQHPSSVAGQDAAANPPLFPNLSFTLPSFEKEHWTVLSPSSTARTTLLKILRGELLCIPPDTRTYPYLLSDEIAAKDLRLRSPAHALQYVGFDAERGGLGGNVASGAYLSARYESRREETDFSVLDYLKGNTELNADEDLARHPPEEQLRKVMKDLRLEELADMSVTNLSNGQTRRARIAKALLGRPEVLLLDGPFMGLDPRTTEMLANLLHELADARSPRLILSLRPDDLIPKWITHLIYVGADNKAPQQGQKTDVLRWLKDQYETLRTQSFVQQDAATASLVETGHHLRENHTFDQFDDAQGKRRNKTTAALVHATSRDGWKRSDKSRFATAATPIGEAVVEFSGVQISYGDKTVLGGGIGNGGTDSRKGLWWELRRGQRWGVFGPNGSGKTTLLSLLTSDHPQTYSQPIKLFGRSRLPEAGKPGISLFDIQRRMGHSSPEVHAFFPKHLSLRRAIESAWADAPLSKPSLTHEVDLKVNAVLRWFQGELHPTLGPRQLEVEEKHKPGLGLGSDRHRIKQMLEEEERDIDALDWADELKFGELSFSAQRIALFIRAVIRNPDLVILDEAFSGMDEQARDKCMLFLSWGETMSLRGVGRGQSHKGEQRSPIPLESQIKKMGKVRVPGLQDHQALLVVSHRKDEVPGCVREWMCLPEGGSGEIRMGRFDGPLEMAQSRWDEVWGVEASGV